MDGAPLVLGAAAALLLCLQLACTEVGGEVCEEKTSTMLSLKKKLMCSYDASVRPVNRNSNTTEVFTVLSLYLIVPFEYYDIVEIHAVTYWRWRDEHLSWDKNEYAGVTELPITSGEVWVPDVALFNSASMSSVGQQVSTRLCYLTHKGNVTCVVPGVYQARCSPNVRLWPFDGHTCSVELGSWGLGDEILFSPERDGIHLGNYQESNEWKLVGGKTSQADVLARSNRTSTLLRYEFEMERHSGSLTAGLVIPSIILAAVTLVTFTMKADSFQRSCLICANILCHCLYAMFLGFLVPASGKETPVIVTLYRDSLVLLVAALLVTVCAARMEAAARALPATLAAILAALQALPHSHLLLGQQLIKAGGGVGVEGQEPPDPASEGAWRPLATLLDRAMLGIFLVVYIVLLCAYLP